MSNPLHAPLLALVILTSEGTRIRVLNGKFEEIGGLQGLAYDPKKHHVTFFRGSEFHSVPAQDQ